MIAVCYWSSTHVLFCFACACPCSWGYRGGGSRGGYIGDNGKGNGNYCLGFIGFGEGAPLTTSRICAWCSTPPSVATSQALDGTAREVKRISSVHVHHNLNSLKGLYKAL